MVLLITSIDLLYTANYLRWKSFMDFIYESVANYNHETFK